MNITLAHKVLRSILCAFVLWSFTYVWSATLIVGALCLCTALLYNLFIQFLLLAVYPYHYHIVQKGN